MKTFRIKDEDGKEFEVKELEAEKDIPEQHDEEPAADIALTSEEIASLKKLAGVADKLVALIPTEDADEDKLEDEEETVEEKIENVVDTDEDEADGCLHDSIEKKETINDSIDVQDEIANAWSKRYNNMEVNE